MAKTPTQPYLRSRLGPALAPCRQLRDSRETAKISGRNFGATQGSSTVTFNGVSAIPTAWSANAINVTVPNGASTGDVVVTVGGSSSTGFLFAISPVLSGVSPAQGAAGAQVTLSGSGFGQIQGTGSLWLGTTIGAIVSWSDTQIVATVAPNSRSGAARVQQKGVWSPAVPFVVNTTSISSVTPSSGLPGSEVTITGNGFGAQQGSGQVWLGAANGIVQSWSDTRVVALVAAGSASGSAQVIQNGVPSNSVPFTVNTPRITDVSPNSGRAGTSVTIWGSGFGSSPSRRGSSPGQRQCPGPELERFTGGGDGSRWFAQRHCPRHAKRSPEQFQGVSRAR